jgi:tRNA-dihydrouridine synthase
MKYYLAPMEGITTEIYRRAYHAYFRPMDKYFTPFLVPHTKKGFNAKEKREISSENNQGMYTVPQILTNNAQDFLNTVKKLEVYGYQEVNLNLGCPSKTVASKYRGSGFLEKTEELDRFLDEIYRGTDIKISIKTRIGRYAPEEFERILQIYNQYPVEELIIHPRVQQDYYKNHPNLDVFEEAVRDSRISLCYNGDINTAEDAEKIEERFPQVDKMMLGRGLIGDPQLAEKIEAHHNLAETQSSDAAGHLSQAVDRSRIRKFHDQIYEDYQKVCSGDRNVLFKMKEIWSYLGNLFPEYKKELKQIRKAEKADRYEEAVNLILF